MAVDLSLSTSLLAEIASLHGMPKGAFNIRKDGELVERHNSAIIDIATKTDNPGIDIRIKAGTKGETVYIPVIVTQSGLKDVVYNTFYIGDDCDIKIVAGCGIHNSSHDASEHDGIHSFYIGKNSRISYVEKHYGEGDGSGERILNPTTNVYMEEGSSCEMEMVQLRGVTSTVRDTNAELAADAKLVLTEKLLTHGNQTAISNMKVELKGEGSSVQVISRSVAQDDSVQVFNPLVIGECACRGHVQCDAIIMGNAKVKAIPGIEAASEDALFGSRGRHRQNRRRPDREAHDAGPHRGGSRAGNPRGLPELAPAGRSKKPQVVPAAFYCSRTRRRGAGRAGTRSASAMRSRATSRRVRPTTSHPPENEAERPPG